MGSNLGNLKFWPPARTRYGASQDASQTLPRSKMLPRRLKRPSDLEFEDSRAWFWTDFWRILEICFKEFGRFLLSNLPLQDYFSKKNIQQLEAFLVKLITILLKTTCSSRVKAKKLKSDQPNPPSSTPKYSIAFIFRLKGSKFKKSFRKLWRHEM